MMTTEVVAGSLGPAIAVHTAAPASCGGVVLRKRNFGSVATTVAGKREREKKGRGMGVGVGAWVRVWAGMREGRLELIAFITQKKSPLLDLVFLTCAAVANK